MFDSSRSKQLPSWWLQGVLHDTREDQLISKRRDRRKKAGLDPETKDEENRAIQEEIKALYKSPNKGDSSTEGHVEKLIVTIIPNSKLEESSDSKRNIGICSCSNDVASKSDSILKTKISDDKSIFAHKNVSKLTRGMSRKEEEEAVRRRCQTGRSFGSSMKLRIKMTSEEEAATVEYRRGLLSTPSQILGPSLLKKRPGNIKTIAENEVVHDDNDNYIPPDSQEEKVNEERSSKNISSIENLEIGNIRRKLKHIDAISTRSVIKKEAQTSSSPRSVVSSPLKKYNGLSPVRWSNGGNKKAFVGGSFSHFDFAMQQRALKIERQEKERRARESLATHHGGFSEVDKFAKLEAKRKEERERRMEADKNLKSFKGAY